MAEVPADYAELSARLAEAEALLAAIRDGEVDPLVLGDDVFTLDSANAATNRMRGNVLAQMEDAVVVVNADDRLTYINPAAERQYGLDASAALGRHRAELYDLRWHSEEERADSAAALRATGAWRGRVVHVKRNGDVIDAESSVTLLRDRDGADAGCLSVVRDVSEREAAERERRAADQALREADRRKDVFLATLAHELRNPLAPIGNSLAVLRLSADPAVHAKAYGVIERQLAQLVHLVDDLLDVGRITQGKLELRRARVELAQIVRAGIETSRPLIDAGGHLLVVSGDLGDAIAVDADLTRMTQVVANLLNNAAKFTPFGGRIEISTAREGAQAVISVADTGIGMAAELLPEVFEMFAQRQRSVDRAHGGLGIGLALVKRLVEMHDGTVEAQSEGAGRGSRFVVRLTALPATTAEPAVGAKAGTGVAGHDACVLIVDDNRDSADSMATLIGMLGFRTSVAYDGDEALRIAADLRPDVVLMDLGMPRMSGHEVARRLRAQTWAASILLIALSGWGQDEDRRRTAEAGFDHHLVKPLDLDALKFLLAAAQPAWAAKPAERPG